MIGTRHACKRDCSGLSSAGSLRRRKLSWDSTSLDAVFRGNMGHRHNFSVMDKILDLIFHLGQSKTSYCAGSCIIGIDLAKHCFQLHGAAAERSVWFREQLMRNHSQKHARTTGIEGSRVRNSGVELLWRRSGRAYHRGFRQRIGWSRRTCGRFCQHMGDWRTRSRARGSGGRAGGCAGNYDWRLRLQRYQS